MNFIDNWVYVFYNSLKGGMLMFASFEKDYIMRIVKELVRMLLKLLFNVDTSRDMDEVIEQCEKESELKRLLTMIDDGQINEAENELYELIGEGDKDYLQMALLFYYHLASKDESFLIQHGYTMQEVKEGTENLIELYDINDIAQMFMQ